MTTHEFLDRIGRHPELPLRWRAADATVPGGYHLTEVKAIRVHAMDCGGGAAHWNETVLQILPPAADRGEASMTVAKFLEIYRRVADAVPVAADGHLRVEYGEVGRPAIGYLVDAVEVDAEGVRVRLVPPTVACKGADPTARDVPVLRDAPTDATSDAGCCGTPVAVAGGGCC